MEAIKEKEPEAPAPKPAKQEELISLLDQPEEKEPEIVLSKDVLVIKNIRNGESFSINDDLAIDIMVSSKKDIKNQLIDEWPKLKKLITHPTLGKAATLLVDGRPLVASNNILVVSYEFANSAEKTNLIINQEDLQNVVQSTFGKKMFIYGLSISESQKWTQDYMNKLQLSRLPKANAIKIEFEGE